MPGPSSSTTTSPPAAPASTPETATTEVRRGDLTAQQEFRGSVSHGTAWGVTTAAQGTITRALAAGRTVEPGAPLIWVDDRPVFLAEGQMPMYRTLRRSDTDRDDQGRPRPALSGEDVRQLQRFLIAQGHGAQRYLAADGVFGAVTERAVKEWQKAVGVPQTGEIDTSQVVFAPTPVRIVEAYRVGSPFEKLEVTDSGAVLVVETNATDRAALTQGTAVAVAVAEGDPLEGTVVSQEESQSSSGESTVIRSTVELAKDLPEGATSATVSVSRTVAADQLLVPVAALVARAEGGYAVELASSGPTRFVPVEVVQVQDSTAAVTGQLSAGVRVVIPG